MKLTYYNGEVPNFGDELNKIMWETLVEPGFFDNDDSTMFLGIGSILWDFFPKYPKKLVMGSGYGGYTAKPNLHDGQWEVAFVRGPRTAQALNLDPKLAISDAAILTRFMHLPPQEKKYKISFMPHFQSIPRGNWAKVCEHAGIHYIDPTDSNVLSSLEQIQQTEVLITEAMHGAILADTLRTPWIALKPISPQHHAKWFDWSESLDIKLQFNTAPSSSLLDFRAKKTGKQGTGRRGQQLSWFFSITHPFFMDIAAQNLLDLANKPAQLSKDSLYFLKSDMALDKLSEYCEIKV